ncbi:helix-turn-helix domain-containing protein [Streptomyces gamaensis]|uniref:Helix-turn-helix domain-containing protein n=1 Tax=Streptomyces gamaensis TaxID=1763542 RepID=A0ABW0Z3W1_9ACTN
MSAPASTPPHPSLVEQFGILLRELRQARGLKQWELAKAVHLTHTVISRYENGKLLPPTEEVVRLLDAALEANGRLLEAWDHLNDSPGAKWIQKYFEIESRAVRIRHLEAYVPALLQNDEYTRAMLERGMTFYGGNLEEKVAFRARRREVLRKPNAPEYALVLGEPGLNYLVGSPEVTGRQLMDLLDRMSDTGVNIRILPRDAVFHMNRIGVVTIFDMPNGQTIVYRAAPLTGLFVTEPASVVEYTAFYDQLHKQALAPKASRVLVRKVLEEIARAYRPT